MQYSAPMTNTVCRIGDEGCQATIWTLGAALNDVRVPDRAGRIESVVLGYGDATERRAGRAFLGEVVGPFANRVAGGRFALDGVIVSLERNEGVNTLHSGTNGLHRQEWGVLDQGPAHVRLGLTWPDGQGGFPGPITIEVSYRVEGSSLWHEVVASTERPTVVSIVSHPYFNLSGRLTPIHDHELTVAASRYLPVSETGIPLPEAPVPVTGPFDLRHGAPLDRVLASDHPQIARCGGLDHAFVLDGAGAGGLTPACVLTHPASGRQLTIETDFPAFQVYSGQGLGDDRVAHPSGELGPFSGLALETEEFPDAPNRPDFPSVILRPGEICRRTTRWSFGVVG